MTTAERFTAINDEYFRTLARAHAMPRTTKRERKISRRRERLISQARRTRAQKLALMGVRNWR